MALFGTDGVRGVAGAFPLDEPTIVRLGAALVRGLAQGDAVGRLLIGRDTRESGPWIERALARGAGAMGAQVTSAGVIPTPAVAYLTRARGFDLGAVISASHNPFADNGIKIFSGRGHKFGEAQERAVERELADASWTTPDAAPRLEVADLVTPYLDHVRRLLPDPGAVRGARLAIDLANGATTATAPRLLRGLGFELVERGNAPDGRNINLDCGSTHPEGLAALVRVRACRLGVAFDGDGDRAILVDRHGRIVDGDAVLLVLARWLHARGALAGETVVATVMSNLGLEKALTADGMRLVRTPVGDKFVTEEMLRHGYVLGGEQSGHVILSDHLFTGDGLATALAVLRVMADTGRELDELAAGLTTYPQLLLNVRVREKRPLESVPPLAAEIARVETALNGRGRLLVRYSGTEPLLRIMIEGEDHDEIERAAHALADLVRAHFG